MARCEDCIHGKVCLHKANIISDTYAYMGIKFDTESCEDFIPTVDVVPSKIFSELEAEITAAFNNNSRVIAEHHKKYGDKANFEFLSACYAKNNTLLGIMDFIEELKKKYTEE